MTKQAGPPVEPGQAWVEDVGGERGRRTANAAGGTAWPTCCSSAPRKGWSPQRLPADTSLKRRIDLLLPRPGWPVVLYFAAVIALVNLGPHLPTAVGLTVGGLAALAAGGWCTVNFWRCRHAHCLVTGGGWLALAVFSFAEAVLGRSLIGQGEGLVFFAVLVAGMLFEGGWFLAHGTNAVRSAPPAGAESPGVTGPAPARGRRGVSGSGSAGEAAAPRDV